MAKITPSAQFSTAHGSVGGLTYRVDRGSLTLRAKRAGSSIGSLRRLFSNALLAHAAARWRTLTAAQRARWNAFAAAHPDYLRGYYHGLLSGFLLFVALACLVRQFFGNDITNPPNEKDGRLVDITVTDFNTATAVWQITFTNQPPAATTFGIYATAPLPVGRSLPSRANYRILGNKATGALSNWSPQYALAWFPPGDENRGQLLGCYGVALNNTGQVWFTPVHLATITF